jgi:hypothetical protein
MSFYTHQMSAHALPHMSADTESGNDKFKGQAGINIKDTWKGRIWDTWDLPRDERRMLWKVDAVLLTLCSVGPGSRSSLTFSSATFSKI